MLVVQKYGGTSVESPERIHRVAGRIAGRRRRGDRVVVVISAMGQTTDELLRLAHAITSRPSRREMDMLLTAGERISMALLSMALDLRNTPAISFTGSQSGIITDTAHGRARIVAVRPIRIGPELDRDRVVIVAGFQGVSPEKEITTLGRGGSDTTAVALAAGLGADRCEIYTDVPGVMTADPRIVPGSRLLPRLNWDTLLEMSCCGAGVMHSRAVELARRRRVPFIVQSSFEEGEGTVVDEEQFEDGAQIVAVTGRPHVAVIDIAGIPPRDGALTALFEDLDTLLEDMAGLHQYPASDATTLTFHIPVRPETEDVLDRLRRVCERHRASLNVDPEHAAVSLVGSGSVDAPAVAARGHRALSAAGVACSSLITGNLSLTFLVARGAYAAAETALHREFLEQS